MKILTKEWMKYNRQVILAGQVKKLEGIKTSIMFDLYNKLYKGKQDEFIELERTNPAYDENDAGIKRDFDEEYAKRLFEARTKNNEELIRTLPENVLSHIQNVKLLGLKYCLPKEIPLLQAFYQDGLKEVEELANKARKITDDSAKNLPQQIDFDLFTEEIVYKIKTEKDDLIIEFEGYLIRAKNITILEKEQECVEEFIIDDPYCGMTVLHAIELYYNEDENDFELHLLLDNIDNLDISTFWYLTVKCNNIYVEII